MSLSTFLRKELAWSRRHLAVVIALFVLVPAVFATGTLFFEHTLPENSPVAVVPANENTSQDDLAVVRGGLSVVSDPRVLDSRSAAFSQLHREEVYAVVEVPPGVAGRAGAAGDPAGSTPSGTAAGTAASDANDETVTIDVHVSGSVTIYRLPSRAMVILLSERLDGVVPAAVEAERHVRGDAKRLSEYLLPTFMMILVMLAAFVYLPASLARERNVFDRLRTRSSLRSVIGAKLLFVGGLVLAGLVTATLVGLLLGYGFRPLSPIAFAAYLLAFVTLASVSVSISLLAGFDATGRVLNVAVFFALIPLSNLAYPAGFFSELSKTIARHNPLHYAMIVARSHLLKDSAPGTFADWLAVLAGLAVLAMAALAVAIERYERTR